VTLKAKFILLCLVVLSFALLKSCAPDRATWYGGAQRGKLMSNGRPFNPEAMTAASWDYPLGTKLKIIHSEKSIVVEITDRGGARGFFQLGKTIDLSRGAFSHLAQPEVGSIKIKIARVK